MHEAIILAGGKGTRLRPVVNNVPKPMAAIGDKPFLQIIFEELVKNNFSRVVISVGYMREVIQHHFGNYFEGITIEYCIEDTPLGTGGAIKLSANKCLADNVFILNGDTLASFDAAKFTETFSKQQVPVMLAKTVEDNSRYGKVVLNGGYVAEFVQPGSKDNLPINAGVYYFPTEYLKALDTSASNSFEISCLMSLSKEQKLYALVDEGFFIDIGIPQDYQRALSILPSNTV